MLDLSQAKQRKHYSIPFWVKLLFLCLPWAFVAYGAGIMQEQIAFYNNSILARAVVVDVQPSRRAVLPSAAAAFQRPGFFEPEPWFVPGFLYTHENGEFYVGGAVVDDIDWELAAGQEVAIRYNRTKPQEAQPVGFGTFWIASAKYIIGGVGLFVALGFVFSLAERIAAERPMEPRRNRRRPSLWKRLKLSF